MDSNITSFFRFVNKRTSYPFGIISLAHVPVSVTRIIQSLYYAPAGRIYFDSDMSKSTNTVVYFDWKTVINIYACGKCRTQFM
jgi:hypothetical protein